MAYIGRNHALMVLLGVLLFACSPAASPPTLTVAPAVSEEMCPQLVAQALDATDANCTGTGRNQVCYGNVRLNAVPQSGVESLDFDQPGDIVDLASVQTLSLSSMNTQTQEWGVALIQVQANIPETMPGQNVTLLLFGNVQVESAPAEDGQFAFFFQTGVGDAPCAAAPDSGILVQTPEGVGAVSFRANGVDIQLGSTAYLQAQPGKDMAIKVVEGEAEVTAQSVTRRIPAGAETSVPLDASRQPSGPPSPPKPYDGAKLQTLPVTHLTRPVGIASVLLSSDFAGDAEGWSAPGEGTAITYFPADDSSDGYICADDRSEQSDWYFQAPQGWLGDQSAAYGGALRFVLRQSAEDAQYDADDVLLTGGGITLKYNTAENPRTDWTLYLVPLVETAGWINTSSGAAPTRDEMITVLSSLSELRIRGEYREGEDTGCLDEVQLTGVLMPVAEGRVVQIEPTQAVPSATPERSVAGQASGEPTATATSSAPTGAQIGFEVSDSLASPSERKPYTFTAEPGHIIYFDSLSGSASLRATVTDDTGAEIAPEWWLDRDLGLVTLERGGTYTITVYSVQDNTGAYSFKLWDVPPPQTFSISIGDTISEGAPETGAGMIETPGVQDVYTFEAEPGQIVYFDGLSGSASLRARVTDDTGIEIMPEWWLDRDSGEITLERGGTYTITAFGYQDATGAYSFKLWDVPPPQTFSISIGDTVSEGVPEAGAGNLESPGAQDVYTFTAEAGQVIAFQPEGGNYYMRATLVDESGAVVFEDAPMDRAAGEFTLERGGVYTLTVSNAFDAYGTYQFQLAAP